MADGDADEATLRQTITELQTITLKAEKKKAASDVLIGEIISQLGDRPTTVAEYMQPAIKIQESTIALPTTEDDSLDLQPSFFTMIGENSYKGAKEEDLMAYL